MQNVAIIGTTGSIGKALEYYVSDNTTIKCILFLDLKIIEDKKIDLDLNSLIKMICNFHPLFQKIV